jgi:hypothetical protein
MSNDEVVTVWEHRWRVQAELERDYLFDNINALADEATDDTGHGSVDVNSIREILARFSQYRVLE